METDILIDSCTDLPLEYIEENNVAVLNLMCQFKGVERADDFGKTFTYKEFYTASREGEISFTTQINVYRYTEVFKKYMKEEKALIYLCFSSALSGSYNNALMAKDMVLEEFPNGDITVIDSRSASLGEGLLAYYALEMLKEGRSKGEIIRWIEENKLKVNHWFTVDDLNHLKRGGRVSGTAAAIGTLLNIKPVLHVDDEGRLIPVLKAKGRKKSIRILADKLKDSIVNSEEQVIAISHGDCEEEALYLKEMILEDVKVKKVIMNNVGPVIGAHSGPGTIALFFLGKNRHIE